MRFFPSRVTLLSALRALHLVYLKKNCYPTIHESTGKVIMRKFWFLPLAALLTSCSAEPVLSAVDHAKLDPMLQELVSGRDIAERRYDISLRPDGTKEYAVIVRTSAPEDVRALGISIGSVFGEIVTVRVSAAELKRLAALKSVRSIQNSGQNTLQNSRSHTPTERRLV